MSVIIKGMDVPIECGRCKLWASCMLIKKLLPSQQVKVFINKIKLDACPIIEIPKNHGDLKDSKLIDDELYNVIALVDDMDYGTASNIIDEVPTILEAEREENND